MYVAQHKTACQDECCGILHDSTGTASPQNVGNRHNCALRVVIHELMHALGAAYGSFSHALFCSVQLCT